MEKEKGLCSLGLAIINQLFVAINLALAHSAHKMSAPSVMNPLLTKLIVHWLHTKLKGKCENLLEILLVRQIPVIMPVPIFK